MKINDIINEDFWQYVDSLDSIYNPEAYHYRSDTTGKADSSKQTSVVTQLEDDQARFTNRKDSERFPSNGWIGKVRAKYKAGHITKEQYKKLLNLD